MSEKPRFRPKTLSAVEVAHFEEATMDDIDPARVRGREKVKKMSLKMKKKAARLLWGVHRALRQGATVEEIAAVLDIDPAIVQEVANEA